MNIRRAAILWPLVLAAVVGLCARPAAWADEQDEPPRRIYVPVEDLDVVLEHDQQGVILSRGEFQKLWNEARKGLESRPPASHPVVVSRADYAARLHDTQLILDATIELDQLAPGWQSVTLPYRAVAVESATLDDQPARIGRGPGEGRPLVVFSREPGRHRLQLQLSTPLAAVGSDKVASLGLAPVSSGNLQIELPAGKFLNADDLALARPAPADRPARYALAVGGKSALALRITDRQAEQTSQSLVFAATALGLNVAPEERTWRAVTSLSVFGKPIDEVTFSVPKALDITAVESTGLERWEISGGANAAVAALRLVYRQPFSEPRTVTLSGVSASVLGQPWTVPTLSLKNATSHLVRVLVQHPPGLRLQQIEAAGVRRVAADEAPPPEMPVVPDMPVKAVAEQKLYYAAWREEFLLSFVTQPRSRELLATIATRIDVTASDLSLRSSVAVQSRFAPLFDFDLVLPVDWQISDVLVENHSAAWRVVPVAAGSHLVRVSFHPPIAADGKVNLTLAARLIPPANWPIEDQPLSLKLPEISLPQVAVTDGRYMIAAGDDLDLIPEDVRGLDPVALSEPEQKAAGAPRLVYEYQDTRFVGTLKVVRKPTRIAAETLAFHRLERETLLSHLEARMAVQGGGVHKLQVSLPESAGTNLRFALVDPNPGISGILPRIMEQTSAPPDNGRRVWTLQLDERAFGLVWLKVELTAPRQAGAAIEPPALDVLAADRQDAFIAVEAGPDQELAITAQDAAGEALPEVDPADLPAPRDYAPRERIVAAYHALRPGFRLTVGETRFERQPVPTAVCDRAILTSVLGEAGQEQHKAEFVLRAVGVQSVRVDLPAGADLWATLVDGQPVEVRTPDAAGDSPIRMIPWPRAAEPGTPQKVELFYRTSGKSLDSGGRLKQTPPRISALSGQGDAQPIEILDSDWTLYYPRQTQITASKGQFDLLEKPSRASLLGRLHQSISLAAPDVLWQKLAAAALVAAAIGLFFFAYRRRGVAGAAAVAAVGLIVVVVAAFRFATFSAQESTGAEYFGETAATKSEPAANRARAGGFDYSDAPAAEPPRASAAEEVRDATAGQSDLRDKFTETMAGVPVRSKAAGQISSGGMPAAAGTPGAGPRDGNLPANVSGSMGGAPSVSNNPVVIGGIPAGQQLAHDGQAGKTSAIGGALSLTPPAPTKDGLPNTFGQPLPPFGNGNAFAPQARPAEPREQQPLVAAGDVSGEGIPRSTGALLSLSMDLPAPADSRTTTFRYSGAADAAAAPTLDIEYQNRRALSFVVLAWQAGVLLLFWFARRWSVGMRGALGILGLIVPLALLPLAPIDILPYLDGLFLGTIWGLVLWALLALVAHRKETLSTLRKPITFLSALLAILVAIEEAGAQDAKPPAAQGSQVDNENARRATARTIVVPYETSEGPLKAARVLLPWDKFLELWNAAHPEHAVESGAPAEGLVSEALYTASVKAGDGRKPTLELTGRLVIHSFKDEQVTIALPLSKVALEKAELDGKSAPLLARETESGAEQAVLVATRGPHVLDLRATLPLEQAGASGKFTLALQPVAAGSLRFVLPAADLNLNVTGAVAAYRRLRDGEQNIAIVPIDAGGNVTVAWAPAQAREAVQGIVHVESSSAVSLSDAGLRISSQFKYTIRQGTLNEALFSLPEGLLVRRIAGPDVGGWELAGQKDARSLKVFLRRPVGDSTAIEFDLFVAQPLAEQTQSIGVPQLVPQQVTRETGTIGVFAERQFSVTVGEVAGLAQIEFAQFAPPPAASQPGAAPLASPLFAYRFSMRPVQLKLLVARQKPQSKGIAEHAVFLGARKMRIASRIELHLAAAPVSEIAVALPPGYLLYDLKSNAVVDYHVESRPGDNAARPDARLIVELASPRTGVIELALEGVVPRAPEETESQIDLPTPVSVGELRSSLAVWLDRIYTATLGDLTGWKSIDPAELSASLRAARPAAVQFAFSSNLIDPPPIKLLLDRAEARLTADALAVVIARETSVQHLLYLRWNIAAAAESRFTFTTPDWLADRLEFDRRAGGVRIREVRSEKATEGRLRWTVLLEEPRTDVATLLAQATLPSPESGRIEAPTVVFEQQVSGAGDSQLRKIEPQHQFLILANQSPERLELEEPDAVEPVPAIDLPIKISSKISDQAAAILKVRDAAATIGWRAQGAQRLRSLPASVNLARLTLVLAHDGSWREEAYYRINNRSRQFLALRMPAGSRILSLFVGNRPSRPIDPQNQGRPNLVLVPLPKTSAGDLSAEVKLVFAGRFERALPKGVQVLRSEIDLPAPHVLSQTEDAAFGMPVAATEWTVVLPDDIDGRRIDDPERSNVSEAAEGAEQLIEAYNERLKMFVTALDSTASMSVRSRAANNLKQSGVNIHSLSQVEQNLAGKKADDRQVREWRDVQARVQKFEQQASGGELPGLTQFRSAAGQSQGVNEGFGTFPSAKDVQDDLLATNRGDFEANAPTEDLDEVFSLKIEQPPDAQSAPALPQDAASKKPAPAKRMQLREETASQSLRLNAAVEQAQVSGGQQGTRKADQAADAEKLLEQTRGAFAEGRAGGGPGPLDAKAGGGRAAMMDGAVAFDLAAGGAGPVAGWAAPGGLSLPIEVPQAGQKLTFSKSGGDARLALGLRPKASLEAGFGLIWTLVCLAIALALIAALGRTDAVRAVTHSLPLILAAAGLLWFFLLPGGGFGFALFVAGALAFGWQHRHS